MALATLKKRADFLRLRGGARCAMRGFVLETKAREGAVSPTSKPRFGFTVTKAMGGAVVRNRIKRRLRAAVAHVAPRNARLDHDYVLIARATALDLPFDDLKKDLERALQRVHQPAERGRGAGHR